MTNTAPAAKKPWFSKTVILNTVALVATFIPAVGEWLKANPVEVVSALAALNVLLRFVTSGKISLAGNDGGSVSALLLCCTLVGVLGFSSISCSAIPGGATGSIYYLDSKSGAKGGLTFGGGTASGTLSIPLHDGEGNVIGRTQVVVPIVVDAAK